MIQIKDGNPETVQLWLAYLRKHQFYGVGMKANVWEFGSLGSNQQANPDRDVTDREGLAWARIGQTGQIGTADKVEELLNSQRFKEVAGQRQALMPTQ